MSGAEPVERRFFGIASGHRCAEHAVAHLEALDTRANLNDLSCSIDARRPGQLERFRQGMRARAERSVHRIYPRRPHLNKNLARATC